MVNSENSAPPTQDARFRLLRSAVSLFTSRGYASTSVREIVELAGVTKPVLYYYFDSKEGIYLEIIRESSNKFESLIGDALRSTGTAEERLMRFVHRLWDMYIEHLDVVRMMHSIFYGPPQRAPFYDFNIFHEKLLLTIRGLVEEGICSKEFADRDAGDMAMLLNSVLNVCMECALLKNCSSGQKDALSRLLKLAFSCFKYSQTQEIQEKI
jgi:TetR/AcrR family transcriptional regulator